MPSLSCRKKVSFFHDYIIIVGSKKKNNQRKIRQKKLRKITEKIWKGNIKMRYYAELLLGMFVRKKTIFIRNVYIFSHVNFIFLTWKLQIRCGFFNMKILDFSDKISDFLRENFGFLPQNFRLTYKIFHFLPRFTP